MARRMSEHPDEADSGAPHSASLSHLLRGFVLLVGLCASGLAAGACQSASQAVQSEVGDADSTFERGPASYVFNGWPGPPIKVWTYAPTSGALDELPIVVVMHGVNRDGDRYRDEWVETATENGMIVLAPNFSSADFPRSASYNLGNMFEGETGAPVDEALWSFSAIDALFADAVNRIGGAQESYALYGHSAGAQFVHRYRYFKPETRAGLFISANAGWYTMPDFGEAFPYGLGESGLAPGSLRQALSSDLVVLLGDRDTDANDPNLRRTEEAMEQGAHRFARGQTFFDAAKRKAAEEGVEFGWRIETVTGAHHSNALMAPSAAALIREWAEQRP